MNSADFNNELKYLSIRSQILQSTKIWHSSKTSTEFP